jgi:hypothetical protein
MKRSARLPRAMATRWRKGMKLSLSRVITTL